MFVTGIRSIKPATAQLFARWSYIFLLFILGSFVHISSAQDLDGLSDQIRNGSIEQKRSALFELRDLGSEKASRIAVPALSDASPIVRATATASVVCLPTTEAVRVIAPLLSDRDPFVRKEAAYALGSAGGRDAAAPLLRSLEKEKDLEVRAAAVAALGLAGDPNSVTFLLSILKEKPKQDDEFLRRSAARSIGLIAQILRTNDRYVVTPQSFLPERFKNIPSGDITRDFPAFTYAGDVLVVVLMNKKESEDTRREAAFALGAIGSSKAVDVLRSNLTDKDPYLVETIKESLLKISGQS